MRHPIQRSSALAKVIGNATGLVNKKAKHQTGGLLSDKHECLCMTREHLVFDVCAA
jgi:hypothetical protein